ncbi:MAG: glycerophosphoryl diester phosphodiesterase membrane domain-containing protein [Candidatus Acidoferrales bacterium]|nr:glycerophosphoryl diester phosphodiesterase membrane domain-containing protein [Candidatus Acidoferrales bacterium]
METAELRPLSLGELLDRTFTLYRGHFWVFVGIMAIPASFGIPMNYLVLAFQGSRPFGGQPPTAPSLGLIAGIFVDVFAYLGVFLLVHSIAVAAVTHAVSEAYLGRRSTVRDSYLSIRGKFWRLIGVVLNIILRLIGIMLVVVVAIAAVGGTLIALSAIPGGQAAAAITAGLLVILVYMFGVAAGVYLALRYAVSIPALMLENLRVLAAVRRSVQLTRGRRGHIFIALLLAVIIGWVGYIVFQAPFSIATMITLLRNHQLPTWLALMTSVSGAVGGAISGPISMIVLVLCYYDTRIRKEAFDLQFMMASLDRPSPAAGTVPLA